MSSPPGVAARRLRGRKQSKCESVLPTEIVLQIAANRQGEESRKKITQAQLTAPWAA